MDFARICKIKNLVQKGLTMKKRRLIMISIFLVFIIGSIAIFLLVWGDSKDESAEKNNLQGGENLPATFEAADGKVYTEYKQYDPKWADEEYWGKTMKRKGCGITAMAIVLSGYGEKDNPKDLQKKYYPVMNYENMSQELLENYDIRSSGFYYDKNSLSEEKILKHLKNKKPLIVCAWTENGANRWTKSSHYLVLLAADDENNIYVANPGGSKYGINKNGWYQASQVVPYLAKVLYIEE